MFSTQIEAMRKGTYAYKSGDDFRLITIEEYCFVIDMRDQGQIETGSYATLHKAYHINSTTMLDDLVDARALAVKIPVIPEKASDNESAYRKMININETRHIRRIMPRAFSANIDNLRYLFMPYLAGHDYWKVMEHFYKPTQRKKFTFTQRLVLLTELVTELATKLHFPESQDEKPLIHFDLTPQNAFLETKKKKHHLRLIDLGLSSALPKNTTNPRKLFNISEQKGNHLCMAPEVIGVTVKPQGDSYHFKMEDKPQSKVSLNSDMQGLCAIALTLFGATNVLTAKMQEVIEPLLDGKPGTKEAFIQLAKTPYGQEGLFEGYDFPKHLEKHEIQIKSLLRFMILQMQDPNQEKRPSSRQMMNFCQALLKLCTEKTLTPAAQEKILESLVRIKKATRACCETQAYVESLKKEAIALRTSEMTPPLSAEPPPTPRRKKPLLPNNTTTLFHTKPARKKQKINEETTNNKVVASPAQDVAYGSTQRFR